MRSSLPSSVIRRRRVRRRRLRFKCRACEKAAAAVAASNASDGGARMQILARPAAPRPRLAGIGFQCLCNHFAGCTEAGKTVGAVGRPQSRMDGNASAIDAERSCTIILASLPEPAQARRHRAVASRSVGQARAGNKNAAASRPRNDGRRQFADALNRLSVVRSQANRAPLSPLRCSRSRLLVEKIAAP